MENKIRNLLFLLKDSSYSCYFGVGKAASEHVNDGYYLKLNSCNVLDNVSLRKFRYNFNILPTTVYISKKENRNSYIMPIEDVEYEKKDKKYTKARMFIYFTEYLVPETRIDINFFLIHKVLPPEKIGGYCSELLRAIEGSEIYYLDFNEGDIEFFRGGKGLLTKKAL